MSTPAMDAAAMGAPEAEPEAEPLPALNHRHIVVSGHRLRTPLRTSEDMSAWLLELVRKVGMAVLFGPIVQRCDTPGNEGVTGVVCIETSHASAHCWDQVAEPFVKADLYSCAHFDAEAVVGHMRAFGPEWVTFVVTDRNGDGVPAVLEQGRVDFCEPAGPMPAPCDPVGNG